MGAPTELNASEFEETLRNELGGGIFNQIFEGDEFVKVERRAAEPGIAEGVYISTRNKSGCWAKYHVGRGQLSNRISIRKNFDDYSDGSSYNILGLMTEEGYMGSDILPVSEEFLRLIS